MSWLSEAANAAADGASDGAAAVGDACDGATGALSDTEAWIAAQGASSWEALEGAGRSIFDPIADDLGSSFGEIVEFEHVLASIERAAEAIPDTAVDAAARALAAVPERYADALSGAVAAWDAVVDDVDRMFGGVVDEVVRAAAAAEEILEATLARLSEAIEQTARLLDLLSHMYEQLIYFLGRVVRCLADLVLMLGGCAGGLLGYYCWKAAIVTANALKPIRQIPSALKELLNPVFPEFSSFPNARLGWFNIWLVENAWILDGLTDTAGTTFAGVTYKGIRLSSVVYVTLPLDLRQYAHVSNVAHELEHVRQMMWFVSEEAFACAYGAGLAMAGGYGQNPFESDAYRLECHEQARILAWLGNPPNALSTPYGNPCDRISRHDPCSKSFW